MSRLGELINRGRQEGWLTGESELEVEDSRLVAAHCAAVDAPTPMRQLASQLRLSSAEVDLLWLLACIELEPMLSRGAELLMLQGMHALSVQIAERLVTIHGEQLSRRALDRLSHLALIEVAREEGTPSFRRSIRAGDRVIDLARGDLDIDPEIAPLATLHRVASGDPPAGLAAALREPGRFVIAHGMPGSGRREAIRVAAGTLGRGVLELACAEVAQDRGAADKQLRVFVREASLHDAIPVLVGIEELGDRLMLVGHAVRAFEGAVAATARSVVDPIPARTRTAFEIRIPDARARAESWRASLPGAEATVIEECAQRYVIGPPLIDAAARTAIASGKNVTTAGVQLALRGQLERDLLGLATRIDCTQQWSDLVFPGDQIDLLEEFVARVRLATNQPNIKLSGQIDDNGTQIKRAVNLIGGDGVSIVLGTPMLFDTTGAFVEDVSFTGPPQECIEQNSGDLHLLRVSITNCGYDGITGETGTLTVEQSTIENNQHAGISTTGDLILSRDLIKGNARGGVIATAPHVFDVTNCFITNNLSNGVGGMQIDVTSAPMARLEFNTIVDNSSAAANHGGGVACTGTLQAKNNVIARNSTGGSTTLAYSQADGCDFNSSTLDASFAGLGLDNSTYRLTPTSPLIDTVPTTDIDVDFDGDPRPTGRASDVGADEFVAP